MDYTVPSPRGVSPEGEGCIIHTVLTTMLYVIIINRKRAATGPAHTRNRLVGVVNLATVLRSNLTYSYYMNKQSITSGGVII